MHIRSLPLRPPSAALSAESQTPGTSPMERTGRRLFATLKLLPKAPNWILSLRSSATPPLEKGGAIDVTTAAHHRGVLGGQDEHRAGEDQVQGATAAAATTTTTGSHGGRAPAIVVNQGAKQEPPPREDDHAAVGQGQGAIGYGSLAKRPKTTTTTTTTGNHGGRAPAIVENQGAQEVPPPREDDSAAAGQGQGAVGYGSLAKRPKTTITIMGGRAAEHPPPREEDDGTAGRDASPVVDRGGASGESGDGQGVGASRSNFDEFVTVPFGDDSRGSPAVNEGAAILASNNNYVNLNEYDQYEDLFIGGQPISSRWYKLWSCSPLVFHDKGLLLARDSLRCHAVSLGIRGCQDRTADFTYKINDILHKHPGPVSYFRVDSSTWNDDTQLANWCKALSKKSTKEIVMMNIGKPVGTVFPAEEIWCSDLLALRLGFMKIPDLIMLSFSCSLLKVLQLICCSYPGPALSYVVSACGNLGELNIGYSVQNLKISSQSLHTLHVWQSKAGYLTIECAPKLQLLTTGIKPERGKSSVLVTVNGVPDLRELHYIMLQHHQFSLNGKCVTREICCFSSVRVLRVGINCADGAHRYALRTMLQCFAGLQSLSVWRMDKIVSDEAFHVLFDDSFVDLDNVLSVKSQLEAFELEGFCGGPAEMDIVRGILRHALKLRRFYLSLQKDYTEEDLKERLEEIYTCIRASKDCCIKCSPIKDSPD